jgi:YD repeat-containing protein
MTSVIDGNGNVTQLVYDDLNRPYQTIYADGSRAQIAYDADDHVVIQTDNNGLQVVSTIDALGRRMRVDLDNSTLLAQYPYPAGAEQFEQYSYDGLGRPLQCTNDFCAISTRFDSLGRAYDESMRFTIPAAGRFTMISTH